MMQILAACLIFPSGKNVNGKLIKFRQLDSPYQQLKALGRFYEQDSKRFHRYKIEAAVTSKSKEEYDNSTGWEIKLKNWC